jgi:amidase
VGLDGRTESEGKPVMRQRAFKATVFCLCLASLMQAGQFAEAAEPINGHWLATADLHGTPLYGRLDIEQQGQRITGQFYGDKFEGTLDGNAIHLVARDNTGGTSKVDAMLKGAVLSGT